MGEGPCSRFLPSLSGQAQLVLFLAHMDVQLQNAVGGKQEAWGLLWLLDCGMSPYLVTSWWCCLEEHVGP